MIARAERRIILNVLPELDALIPMKRANYKTFKKAVSFLFYLERYRQTYGTKDIPTASRLYPDNKARLGRVFTNKKALLKAMKMKHRRFYFLKDILMRLDIIDNDCNLNHDFLKRLNALKIKMHSRLWVKPRDININCTKTHSISVGTHQFSMKILKKVSRFWSWEFDPITRKIKMHSYPAHIQSVTDTQKYLLKQKQERLNRVITPLEKIRELRAKHGLL